MGKGGGKSTGKAIFGFGMAAFGFYNPAVFGLAATGVSWMGALYGLSLGTTIWSTLNPEKQSDTSYFDYQMNSVAPNQMIPIIYGEHKMGGLQTYHYTNKNGKSMVKDIIMPVLSLFTGKLDFANWFIALDGNTYMTLAEAQEAGAATLNYGNFISGIINFVIMAFVVFMLVKGINKMKKEEAPAPAAPTTKKCPFCKSEIALDATKCPHCTSNLE